MVIFVMIDEVIVNGWIGLCERCSEVASGKKEVSQSTSLLRDVVHLQLGEGDFISSRQKVKVEN